MFGDDDGPTAHATTDEASLRAILLGTDIDVGELQELADAITQFLLTPPLLLHVPLFVIIRSAWLEGVEAGALIDRSDGSERSERSERSDSSDYIIQNYARSLCDIILEPRAFETWQSGSRGAAAVHLAECIRRHLPPLTP